MAGIKGLGSLDDFDFGNSIKARNESYGTDD